GSTHLRVVDAARTAGPMLRAGVRLVGGDAVLGTAGGAEPQDGRLSVAQRVEVPPVGKRLQAVACITPGTDRARLGAGGCGAHLTLPSEWAGGCFQRPPTCFLHSQTTTFCYTCQHLSRLD